MVMRPNEPLKPDSNTPIPKKVWTRPEFTVISKAIIQASFNPGDDGFGLSTAS